MSNPAAPAPALRGGSAAEPHGHSRGNPKLVPLALGALGIVYGDIGTSPLYALKECFHSKFAVEPTPANVLGVLSLFFWSLTMVVAVKYLGFIMRADNKGEGGLFALMALLQQKSAGKAAWAKAVMITGGLFGATLLYGDGIITPAISVLSAVEGLEVATAAAKPYVVLITVAILIALFLIQKRGTEGIGRVFGPVMIAFFLSISGFGLAAIVRAPGVLEAVLPTHAIAFFVTHQWHGVAVLASVVLCVTGGEALYADMGHFGKKPIRLSWFAIVFPSLLLNYFGQGALMLEHGAKMENPFYGLVPTVLLYPMVALSTAATVVASQALISGAFSLTRQAVQLGFLPRVQIVHTSKETEGQIYIPEVNVALAVACVLLVLATGSSTKLAGAYGMAVTGTMTITSVLFFFVCRWNWGWSMAKALPLLLLFLTFDLSFFGANLLKFFDGGWFPIVLAMGLFVLMTTWKSGRAELGKRFQQQTMPLGELLTDLESHMPHRVRGTAVFMSGSADGTPPVLLHHLKHNQVLHRQVVLLSILSADVPTVDAQDALKVEELDHGFFRVVARTGFMQTPNVPQLLLKCRELGLVCEPSTTSYYLGRETLLTTGKSSMGRWRKAIFAFVSRNSRSATSYFGIPPGRVVELGMQVDL